MILSEKFVTKSPQQLTQIKSIGSTVHARTHSLEFHSSSTQRTHADSRAVCRLSGSLIELARMLCFAVLIPVVMKLVTKGNDGNGDRICLISGNTIEYIVNFCKFVWRDVVLFNGRHKS